MKRFLKWGLVLLASLIVILMCTAVVISYVNRPYARAVYDRIKRILDKDFYDHLYLGSSFEIINLDTMDIHSYMKKDQEELPASLSKLFTIDYALSVLSL
ncbi:TPA: D-alanyl-D-alanine carboxypeptidase, partial [Enterococcus faecium]